MLERGYGRIIGISSVVGQKGNIGQTNYAAAKAAIIGFTKALALETAKKGITVNAVAPGFVKTAMTGQIPKEILDKIVETIPVGRMAEPSEVARAVLFLADEKSSYITGQVVNINGGLHVRHGSSPGEHPQAWSRSTPTPGLPEASTSIIGTIQFNEGRHGDGNGVDQTSRRYVQDLDGGAKEAVG